MKKIVSFISVFLCCSFIVCSTTVFAQTNSNTSNISAQKEASHKYVLSCFKDIIASQMDNDVFLSSEILAIYTSEKQIEVALGDGASYVAISPAYYLVDTFIDAIPEGGFNRIYIRYAATATEPASNSLVLTLYGRNPNTPDAVYYENGALYNLTSDMVFRFNGGAWYSTEYSAVNVTSFMSSTETTLLEIRYMPTDSASCSAIREITLPILA